jgi:hypothetical protein
MMVITTQASVIQMGNPVVSKMCPGHGASSTYGLQQRPALATDFDQSA